MKFSIAKTVFSLVSILMFGVLPVFAAFAAMLFGRFEFSAPLVLVYLLQIAVFVIIQKRWQGNVFYALLSPPGLLMFTAILFNSMIKVLSGRGVTWKGRAIYEAGGTEPPK